MTMLKEYRISNNLSQQEMAEKIKCSFPAYRNYESGKRVMPHKILANFLKLRGLESDLKILELLNELILYKKGEKNG